MDQNNIYQQHGQHVQPHIQPVGVVVQTSIPQVTSAQVTSVAPPGYGSVISTTNYATNYNNNYAMHQVPLAPEVAAYTQAPMPTTSYTTHSANSLSNLGGGGKVGRAKKGECNTDMLRALNRILASQMKKLNEAPRADGKIIAKMRNTDPSFPALCEEPHEMTPVPSDYEVANALNVLKRRIAAEGRGLGDRFDALVVFHRGHNDDFDYKHIHQEPEDATTPPNNSMNKAIEYVMELFRAAFPTRLNPPSKRAVRKPKTEKKDPQHPNTLVVSGDYTFSTQYM